MEFAFNVILLVAGFVMLIKGADIFVDGSSSLAGIFKVPSVVIGLTIVALGTSAPELAVSTSAAIARANELALSNVIGSNIFNLLVVLGICAIIKPIPIERQIARRDFPFNIITSVMLFAVLVIGALMAGISFLSAKMNDNVSMISRAVGIIMIVAFIAYIVILVMSAMKNKTEENVKKMSPAVSVLFILLGIGLIVLGGQLVVNSAKYIAAFFGMSETLIGLTIVAVGTSLPELVTSIVASRKGENELAVGNVVGSNIFNMLLILGVSAAINPIGVSFASLIDFTILLAVSVMVFIFSITKHINRTEGVVMVLAYIGAMIFAIFR